jgi:signal peptidase I
MFPELITELLQDGFKVNFRAPGHSMFPTILANETIRVEPIDPSTVRSGDIILYRTNGRLIAHRVIRIKIEALHFIMRGDAATVCDEPVTSDQILGKVVSIERNGRSIDPYTFRHKLSCWASRIERVPRIFSLIFSSDGR